MPLDSYRYAEVAGDPGASLLFAFHGTGGDENQLLPLARAVLPGAAIVAPRGDVSEHGAARYFRRSGEGVYDMDDLARRTAAMAEFVRAHIRRVEPPAVAGLGYSNGANILASVLFAAPDLFDGVVLLHPLIPFEPEPKASLDGRRVLITAGRKDPICPPELTLRLDAYLRALGADVTLVWHDGGHELRQVELDAAKRFLAQPSRNKENDR